MAFKQRIQLRNVSNVAASRTALIEVPIGKRYHKIVLQHGYSAGTNTIAAAATNILGIRVKVNGHQQRTFGSGAAGGGTELRDYNTLQGTTMASLANSSSSQFDCTGLPNDTYGTSFPIFFNEPWLPDAAAQDALAWPSSKFASFQIEVDLGAATSPVLAAYAVVDDFVPQGDLLISKQIRQSFNASGTSFDISTIERRDFLRQILIYPDSGGSRQPSKVTLRKDGLVLHELTYSQNLAELTNAEMTPLATGRTSNIYDLVLDADGYITSQLNMNGTRDVTLTIEALSAMSGTTIALVERLGPLE